MIPIALANNGMVIGFRIGVVSVEFMVSAVIRLTINCLWCYLVLSLSTPENHMFYQIPENIT